MRKFVTLLLLLMCAGAPAQDSAVVLASTSWVAAMALAAGADQVGVIAPAGLVHPADYDPKPTDLLALSRATLVLVGGYEAFVPRLRQALYSQAKMLTVNTVHDPQVLRQELAIIATALGTTGKAEAFADIYQRAWLAGTLRLRPRVRQRNPVVVVQRFMAPWAQLLGVKPVATFGPEPLSPQELRRLQALAPTLIIDNAHATPATALAELTGASTAVLVNFPQAGDGLLDVLRSNTQRLHAALTP